MTCRTSTLLTFIVAFTAASDAAWAQLALSANDGKQVRPGEAWSSLRPDDVTVFDLSTHPAQALGTVEVPTGMIGPPTSIAVARKGGFALVTASLKIGPDLPPALVPGNTLSLIDVSRPSEPRVTQTLSVGPNPSGVAISNDGKTAMVASAGDDSVSLFAIARGRLTLRDRLVFDKGSRPIDVDIAPNGRFALVALQNGGRIVRLKIARSRLILEPVSFAPGLQPYGVHINSSGTLAYVALLGGRPLPPGAVAPRPRIGAVAVLDLAAATVADVVDVGVTPEHISLSPDGRFVQVVLINGSNALPSAPNFKSFGFVKVLRVDGKTLRPVAEARTGGWCQGATWSADSKRLFVQCTSDRVIEVYGFDGRDLTPLPDETLRLAGRPGAIATAASR